MMTLYLINTIFVAAIYFGNLNYKAFKEIGAYCPSKMEFIILIEYAISIVGLVFYVFSMCITSSDVFF